MEQLLVRNEFERIVEYPFLFRNLNPVLGDKIMDIGCVESEFSIKMSRLGYKVWGVDFRKYPYAHENLVVLQGDIMKLDLPGDLDWIVNISTQEHIGIGFNIYGDPFYQNKDEVDEILFNKYYECLKPGGKMILTVPFGKSGYTTHFHKLKIYGKEDLDRALRKFKILDSEFWHLDAFDSRHVPFVMEKTTPEEVAKYTDFGFYPTKGTCGFFLEK